MAVVPDRRLALSDKLKILETNKHILKDALMQLSKIVTKQNTYISNSSDSEHDNKDYNNDGKLFIGYISK